MKTIEIPVLIEQLRNSEKHWLCWLLETSVFAFDVLHLIE